MFENFTYGEMNESSWNFVKCDSDSGKNIYLFIFGKIFK